MRNFVRHEIHSNFKKLQYLNWFLFWGAVVETMFSPKGWQKNFQKCRRKSQKWLDSIDCKMVLSISTRTFDAENTPDALKHVRRLFWRAPRPENKVQGPGPEYRDQVLLNYVRHQYGSSENSWFLKNIRLFIYIYIYIYILHLFCCMEVRDQAGSAQGADRVGDSTTTDIYIYTHRGQTNKKLFDKKLSPSKSV